MQCDALLFQLGIGAVYQDMLAVSRQRHAAYCAQHGMDFWSWDTGCGSAPPMWQKYVGILQALQRGYEMVAFLDADCLIVDMDADLREATQAPLGLLWGQVPGGEPAHYNCGVMYARRGSFPFFAEMVRLVPPGDAVQDGPWWTLVQGEQRIANTLLAQRAWAGLVHPIAPRWNTIYGFGGERYASVLAWHGVPGAQGKLERMRAWCQRLS